MGPKLRHAKMGKWWLLIVMICFGFCFVTRVSNLISLVTVITAHTLCIPGSKIKQIYIFRLQLFICSLLRWFVIVCYVAFGIGWIRKRLVCQFYRNEFATKSVNQGDERKGWKLNLWQLFKSIGAKIAQVTPADSQTAPPDALLQPSGVPEAA